jgi:hypothetical protein
MELVRFDTQLMEQPDLSGVAYQQGTLQGFEVREFLLRSGAASAPTAGQVDYRCRLSTSSHAPATAPTG